MVVFSAVFGLFATLRIFGMLDFSDKYEGSFFEVAILPEMINWISVPENLLLISLSSIVFIGVFRTMKFFKELKKQ